MMTKISFLTVTLTVIFAAGCSRSSSSTAVAVGTTVAAALPSLTKTASGSSPASPAEPAAPAVAPAGSNAAPAAAPAPVSPFPEMGDLFAPPKVVVPVVTIEPEPEPEPTPEPIVVEEPKKVTQRPNLRLVGFAEVEGLKALLSIEGKLNVATIGDSPEGLQIIAIEPPLVTLKYGQDGEEFQMNLYEQEWFHPAGAFAGERKPVMQNQSQSQKPSVPNRTDPPLPGVVAPPNGAPIPGVGAKGAPGAPGFGGVIGPPGAPGFKGSGMPNMPNIPGLPGENSSSNSNGKNSKRNSK